MNDLTEWYWDWWMAELPGRTWSDLWYERLYDWRLRDRPAHMIGRPHE